MASAVDSPPATSDTGKIKTRTLPLHRRGCDGGIRRVRAGGGGGGGGRGVTKRSINESPLKSLEKELLLLSKNVAFRLSVHYYS